MIVEKSDLAAGLYLIATPIGAARDITLRALDICLSADILIAEDTRSFRHLMQLHGIAIAPRPLWSYHDHSGPKSRESILGRISSGSSVVYASEAGTPLIADPGYQLVKEASQRGLFVHAAPGPSALICALMLAGLPTDKFLFLGFLPHSASGRRRVFEDQINVFATLVFFENAKRLPQSLSQMIDSLGDREVAMCREMTKKFETIWRGRASTLLKEITANPPKGEIVMVVGPGQVETDSAVLEARLHTAMETMSTKEAALSVSQEMRISRREAYQIALKLKVQN